VTTGNDTAHALVVGGYGALGTAIAKQLTQDGFVVLRTSRVQRDGESAIIASDSLREIAMTLPPLDAVVWAHGVNINDSAANFEADALGSVLDANVTLVARQLSELISRGRIQEGSRLVVLSSVWEEVARSGKFSYTVSKAALGGLVRAAALDLADRGILINAVLPGVVDTPMTRAALSPDQITAAERATPFGKLVQPGDVATLVAYLCSPANTGVTGQSIAVDLGFSIGRSL
jgi:3-oxoacyl-[acyl-carrier protein] reductase